MVREITLILAGDAVITRPWSHVRDDAFLDLMAEIRAADVSIANLETVIHDFRGPAQADAGGVYLASPPVIAAELKWAGLKMLAHANNHAFDYGSSGIIETIQHCEKQGLIIAGSATDLQRARSAAYFKHKEVTVALVSMASDFVRYGKASFTRGDVAGRPGINPLSVERSQLKIEPFKVAQRFRDRVRKRLKLSKFVGKPAQFEIIFEWGRHANRTDVYANLDAISKAAAHADVVVASIHAHRQGAWLRRFARQAINYGADLVHVHGPHQIRGIEIYRGRPIFYSLGNFVFESEYVTRLPAEAYQRVGLAADAPLEALRARYDQHMSGLLQDRDAYQSIIVRATFSEKQCRQLQLIPIDLNFDDKHARRGRPQLATPQIANEIIRKVMRRSREFKTAIRKDAGGNVAEVICETKPKALLKVEVS